METPAEAGDDYDTANDLSEHHSAASTSDAS
jgi:hypothetical protein